jgi:putative tricarboxylic transport membrane protein
MTAREPAARPIGSEKIDSAQNRGESSGSVEGASGRSLHTDVIIGIAILAFCALIWAGTATFEDVPAALTQGMGPAAFPRLILGVIALLAIWLAWSSRARPDPSLEPMHPFAYFTGIAIIVFMAVLDIFGMYAAILFATIGIGRLWGERRWWLLAVIGIGLVAVTHLTFVVAFHSPLPRGRIEAWLT